MLYSAIIPAAGKGERLGLGYNKVLFKDKNSSIIEKTLIPFVNDKECSEIILVCSKADIDYISSFIHNSKIKFILGGSCREESVYNGVNASKEDYILIHDGARPFVSEKIIFDIKEVLSQHNSVIPVVKSKDATLINGRYDKNIDVCLIQTPQAFRKDILLLAMNKAIEKNMLANYKDDASIVQEELGINPTLVCGDYNNIKITTISDLKSLEVEENA